MVPHVGIILKLTTMYRKIKPRPVSYSATTIGDLGLNGCSHVRKVVRKSLGWSMQCAIIGGVDAEVGVGNVESNGF
jgi:hypothetical protein